jgi:hypothetical protein
MFFNLRRNYISIAQLPRKPNEKQYIHSRHLTQWQMEYTQLLRQNYMAYEANRLSLSF